MTQLGKNKTEKFRDFIILLKKFRLKGNLGIYKVDGNISDGAGNDVLTPLILVLDPLVTVSRGEAVTSLIWLNSLDVATI